MKGTNTTPGWKILKLGLEKVYTNTSPLFEVGILADPTDVTPPNTEVKSAVDVADVKANEMAKDCNPVVVTPSDTLPA